MHEPYDDNDDYYGDNYDDSQEYNKSQPDWDKLYFKFDIFNTPISDWIKDIFNDPYNIKNIPEFPVFSFPVNNYFPNTVNGGNSILYLGNNYQNQPIWKTKYFIKDDIDIFYKNHLKNNAEHFIKQPHYYRSLFDILN